MAGNIGHVDALLSSGWNINTLKSDTELVNQGG